MTKRVLSLLLTLVMVLSLCVPALAADEFEAEAPAEVVEEAPAAPVEPEAPEAEEPVEAPVVEEAPAEEPVADEPAIASIEADEPYLVALGVISKEAHYKLELALEVADKMKAKVDAGEVYIPENWTKIGQAGSATADFDTAYAEAKRCMDAINGLTVVGDVSSADVENATSGLLATISEDDDGEGEANTDTVLTSKVTDASNLGKALAVGGVVSFINSLIGAEDSGSAYEDASEQPDDLDSEDFEALAEDIDGWKTAYQADYLKALKGAVEAADKLDATSTYKDYAAVAAKFAAAAKLEPNASKPAKDDAATLKAAIDKVAAAKKDTKTVWIPEPDTLDGAVEKASKLLVSTTTESTFGAGTTYLQYTEALKNLALEKNTTTLQVYKAVLNTNNGKDIQSIDIYLAVDKSKDNNNYAISYKVGKQEYKYVDGGSNEKSSAETKVAIDKFDEMLDSAPGLSFKKITLTKDVGNFASTDEVVVRGYTQVVGGEANEYSKTKPMPDYKVNMKGNLYDGPGIDYVTVTTVDDNMYITAYLDNEFDPDSTFTPVLLHLVDANGKPIASNSVSNVSGVDSIQVMADAAAQKKMVVGKMEVQLCVPTVADGEAICHENGHGYATIEPLSKNATLINAANKIVEDAEDLIKADWKLTDDGKVAYPSGYDKAWSDFQSNIKTVKDTISGASKLANTPVNEDKLEESYTLIQKFTNDWFTEVTPNREDYLEAFNAAVAVEDEGYTYQTWGALKVALEKYSSSHDGETALTTTDYTLQSQFDKAAEALNAAVAALAKENGVDKASLKSAIDAASALKEADYTAESWKAAALADAIKAAQTVYDNKNATQAQVNAAIEALRTAQGKLVKKADTTLPTAPAGWSGWKQDTAGNWYYFRNGELKKDYWVTDASAHDLWYHVGADGKMDTGFKYIVDKTHGAGWFMLQATTTNGMQGAALTGWQATGSSAGDGYFEPTHNGHYAECTWTKAWGDYNFTTKTWTDGQQHVG